MTKKRILVLGGTGKTGKRIIKLLENADVDVRLGSREAVPPFDWGNVAGWKQVFENIDSIYIAYQPDLAVPGALVAIDNLVKTAAVCGVKKLVLLSGKGEKEAQKCENKIIKSGLEYTIIRASWFNQNFSESFLADGIIGGNVALPYSDVKIPFVDVNDIAEVAFHALTNDSHSGKIYELTGPEGITFKEAVNIISTKSRRNIQFSDISMDSYIEIMRQNKIPDDFIWLIEYLFNEVLGNEKISEITHDIQKVLDREPIKFSQYAEMTVKEGIWNS